MSQATEFHLAIFFFFFLFFVIDNGMNPIPYA
jgi:hypothetical protein